MHEDATCNDLREIITQAINEIKQEQGENFSPKNEILNSASPRGSSVYFCTVDIYSFIHPWYGYLSF